MALLTKTFEDKKPFPFLQLPGELRNKIYALLLTNNTVVKTGAYRGPDSEDTPLSITVSVLRASRQTYAEAMPLLYSLNRFQAHPSLLTSLPFLADANRPVMSPIYLSLIRKYHIAVRLDCDPFWTSDDLDRAFSGIEELAVEGWQASFSENNNSNLLLFSSVRGVGRAIVYGVGLSLEFTRWLEATMESTETDIDTPWNTAEWNVWEYRNR